jgi:type I restriction enzyme S subunit
MSTRPYPSYKDSGVEWLGRIPAHWQVKRLKYVVRQNPESLPETTDPDYELQYLDIGNVEEVAGVGSPQEMRFSNAPSRARRRVRSGDTIVSTVRTYLKAIAYFDDPPENLIVSTGFAVLRPNREVHPKFLHALVRSRQFVEKIVTRSVGVGYPAINPGELSCLPVWLPSPTEQQAIAEFLDRETGKIDALVKKKERLIELLQEQRTALISHAVTQGLTPNAPKKDSGTPWLGLIPRHWSCYPLRRIIRSVCDGPFGSDMKSSHYGDSGIRLIRLQNIGQGYFDDTDKAFIPESHFLSLPGHDAIPGDLLVAGLGDDNHPVGRACILPGHIGTAMVKADCFRVRLDQSRLAHVFAMNFLCSSVARAGVSDQTRGATRARMNLSGLTNLCVPVPPIPEQKEISDFISAQTTKLDALVAKVRTVIERLQEYRTALISAAVTGQIDVRREAA